MTFDHPSRLIQSTLTLALAFVLVFAAASTDAQNRERKEDPLLSQDDIELIKVYEVDLKSDPAPRVIIPRDKLRDFLKEYQEDDEDFRGKSKQDAFLRASGHIQLGKMFKHKARDYYKHVRIRSQIASFREWGNIHRRYILGYFQPTFGAGAIPELYLFPRGRDADRIEMTNLYILTQVEIDGKPIIDRNVPEDSLLVQWGLPREEAKFPAPDDIEGWEPKFKNMDDERFEEKVDWIKSLIPENQGESLGIQYKMPKHQKSRNE